MSNIDEKIDAAWRATSREEPSAALDDAIRAAARRAVDAGPSRARHMRSWPLAAAAVVAVLAIGIVQLTPPEQVAPTIVADNASRLDALRDQHLTPTAAPAIDATTQAAPAQVAAPPVDRANSAQRKQVTQPTPAPPLVLADRVQPSAPKVAGGVASGEMTAARERDAAEAKSTLEKATPAAAAKKERPEPFPAAPTEAKVAADVPAAPTSPPPASVAANPSAPALAGATSAAARAAQNAERTSAPTLMARAAPEPDRAKDAAPRTPDEWIKLIRRLQNEGRKDDVNKELAAFRAEYKERAEALLPADLRELK